MAYGRHALVQFGGTMGGGAGGTEEWSCGLRLHYDHPLRPDENLNADEQEEFLNNTAVPALANFWIDEDTRISSDTKLEFVKFNAIGENGKYVNPTTTEFVFPSNGISATGGARRYPLQVSVVATLETDVSRGVASKGRIYLPSPTLALDPASGLFDNAQTQLLADRVAQLVSELANDDASMSIAFEPAVMSNVARAGVDKFWRRVERVSIDTVPDIQRRRANDLRGSRFGAAISIQ